MPTLTIANKKLTKTVARFNLPPNIVHGGYAGPGDAFPEPSGTITVGYTDTRIEFMEQIDRNINLFSPDKKMGHCIDSSTRVDVDMTISTHGYL